jgi:hypothetical protein
MLHKYNEGLYGDALIYYKKSEDNSNIITCKTVLFKALLYYQLGLDDEFYSVCTEYWDLKKNSNKRSNEDHKYMENFLALMLKSITNNKYDNFQRVNLDLVSTDIKDLFNSNDLKRMWDK